MDMTVRALNIILVILFVQVISLPFTFGEGSLSGLIELLRFDKYQTHMSVFRFIVIIFVLTFFAFSVKISASGILGVLYPTNIFFLFISIMILPGVFLTSDYSEAGFTSFYGYAFSIVLFSVGVLVVFLLENFLATNETHSQKRASKSYLRTPAIFWLFIVIYLFGLAMFVLFSNLQVSVFGYIGQFLSSGTVSSGVSEIAEGRQAIYSEGSKYKGIVSIVSSYSVVMLMPLAASYLFIDGLLKRSNAQIVLAVLFIVVNFMLLIANGMRLRGLFFILYIVVAYSFVSPIKFVNILKLGGAVFFLLIIQTIALGRMTPGEGFFENIVLSANRVIERLLLTKGYVTQRVFEYIPDVSGYKGGDTFIVALGGQLRGGEALFAEEMNEFILGYAGTAGPQAFAEGYANFGLEGMFLVAFLLGVFVQLSTYFVKLKFKPDALKITFLAYFSVLVGRVGYGDTFTFKNNGLHILIAIWVFVSLYSKLASVMVERKNDFGAIK